jgi:hypothetical protein
MTAKPRERDIVAAARRTRRHDAAARLLRQGTATRRPTAGPDGLPLTSVTQPRHGTAMPAHHHHNTPDQEHSRPTQISTAPASATWKGGAA